MKRPPALVGRPRRILATATAAVLLGGLFHAPAQAAKPEPFTPPAAKKMPAVAVSKVDPVAVKQTAMPDGTKKPAPVWPAAGAAEVVVPGPATAAAPAGNLPVRVSQPGTVRTAAKRLATAPAPARVRVRVLDRAATTRAGVRGLLLQVDRTDQDTHAAAVDLSVDYGTFRTAYGGDWASRLRLVALPACALTTPQLRQCVGTPLPSRNDPKAGTVTATVGLPQTANLLAVAAATSGAAGSFAATSLQPSSTWSAGGSSGDFSWSYPMRVPPAAGSPAPSLSLSYSAQSVDGRQAASNNQPSWVGEGFDASVGGYIERRYEQCQDDMDSGANNTTKTGDMCWATDNATLSLGGHSGELLYNSSEQRWHLRNDDGSRIERKTGASNGDNDGEYWVVTTTDGTQYWFGAQRLPGWTADAAVTNSAWTLPVYGNHAGEPCHATAFTDSSCTQAWRWNLDYVVDVNGNTASYWYATDTNKYARNMTSSNVAGYIRDGHLDHIEYGTRRDSGVDSRWATAAPARVDFEVADRCLSGCGTHDEAHWPDTPWDQECTGSPCETYSPSFWSTKRLSTITTKIWNGSSYDSVDQWKLTHTFPDPGDGTRAGLWLSKLSHTGLAGGTASVPDVEFSGVQMNNRVDTIDFAAAMNWWRISQIRYESGGTVSVLYSDPECVAKTNVPTAPASNTKRCYPVRWTPEGYQDPVIDYFHKYVVTTVYEADNTGGVAPKGSPRTVHKYTYPDPPAWHYADDDGLIEKKDKTWSVWRGYSRVGVTVGDTGEQTYTETKYFRGMHGDKDASGTRTVTVTGTGVPTVNDEDAYAGTAREITIYNGPGGAVISRQVTEPWQSAATASRTINGDTVVARFTRAAATHERTVLDGGRGERVHTVRSTYDAYGMTATIDDAGDTAVTGDESCTKTTYEPRNSTAWLMAAAHRSLALAVPCGSASDPTTLTDADIISDTRAYFDGTTTYGTAPTRGLVTRSEAVKAWNAGSPTYEQVSRAAYDSTGRVTSSWDALDHQSTTSYTPAAGGLVTQTVLTNALGHTTTTTIAPAWGAPSKVVDPNGKKTEATYDPLGRTAAVWNPGRDKATQTANTTFSYRISNTTPSAVGTSTLNPAGNYLTNYTLYDGLLRQRQTQSVSPSGGRLLTDVFYDTAGRQAREHGSYYATGVPSTTLSTAIDRQDVPNQTRLVYDGAGRTTASIFQPYTTERWRTSTAYGGDRVDVTPPTGGTATSTVTNALGRTTAVREYQAATPSGAYDATSYKFNRKGQLEKVTDAAGNHWDYTYDLRGRQLTAADPDKGTVTSTYDADSRVTSTLDARGIKLQYTYDNIDRRTAVLQTGVGTRARWFYDTLAKGQLDKSIRYVGVTNYTRQINAYDDAYRPTQETVTIPSTETGLAGSYTSESYYNVDGSLNTSGYPAAADLPLESVSYQYDATTGLPTTSASTFNSRSISYAGRTTYDALGRVSELMLYPGLYDGIGKRVYQTFGYELETGRLTSTRTDRDSVAPYTLTNTSYTYDNAGNVSKMADAATGDNQCYQYDYLRRLTQAWTPGTDNCTTAPSTAALGGPAPYWQSWTYDVTGNRTNQVDHATTAGGPDTTTKYTYPAAGAARPHTLTSAAKTTVGGPTITTGYTYDETGNTLTRTNPAGNAQTLTWDPEGHLGTSTDNTGTTSYLYDADGNRLISRDSTGATLFLPGQDVRYTTATGATACTRYYNFAGSTIASRTASGVTWLSSDHQGTATLAIDRETQNATIRRQNPFGVTRGAVPAWPNTRGFVGGTSDGTGLTHLGAREYDPGIGRFISVDPVQDLSDPQQWNGYTYAGSNPVTRADPSGLFPKDPDLDDQFGHELPGTGKYDHRTPGMSGGKSGGDDGGNGAASQEAQKRVDDAKARVVTVGKAILKIAMDIIGVTSALDCFTTGDLGACVETGINVLMSFVGGLAGKIVAKYAFRFKAAYRLGKQLKNLAGELIDGVREWKGARKALDEAKAARKSCNSFAPGTGVLLADGSRKPIEKIKLGDLVVATDPKTGRTVAKAVTRLIAGEGDKSLVRITVDTDGRHGDRTGTVVATDHHPFWVPRLHRWVDATDLQAGQWLQTSAGTWAQVAAVTRWTEHARVHNLTIDDLHTYYVLAGKTPVLVHNAGGDDEDIYDRYSQYDDYEDDPADQKMMRGNNQASNRKARYQEQRAGITDPEQREKVHREIGSRKIGGNENVGADDLREAIEDAGGEC